MDEQSDDASESDPEMDAFLDAELRPAELHQKPEASRSASAHASPAAPSQPPRPATANGRLRFEPGERGSELHGVVHQLLLGAAFRASDTAPAPPRPASAHASPVRTRQQEGGETSESGPSFAPYGFSSAPRAVQRRKLD